MRGTQVPRRQRKEGLGAYDVVTRSDKIKRKKNEVYSHTAIVQPLREDHVFRTLFSLFQYIDSIVALPLLHLERVALRPNLSFLVIVTKKHNVGWVFHCENRWGCLKGIYLSRDEEMSPPLPSACPLCQPHGSSVICMPSRCLFFSRTFSREICYLSTDRHAMPPPRLGAPLLPLCVFVFLLCLTFF